MRENRAIRLFVATLLILAFQARSEGPLEKPAAPQATGQSAARVAVDPLTSQVAPPSAALDAPGIHLSPELAGSLSTSHTGLSEEPVPGIPGAYRVDLRGRFQSAMVAVVTPDGGLEVVCGTVAEKPSPKAEKGGPRPAKKGEKRRAQ